MYGAAKRLSLVMVTARSFASRRDSSECSTASASASSTSFPISVSKMTGTGCAAKSAVASRNGSSRTTSSVLPDREHADLGPAAEAHTAHVADSARDMDLARAPWLQAGHVSLVLDRRITRALERHDHLSAMRVAAQHQVPRAGAQHV